MQVVWSGHACPLILAATGKRFPFAGGQTFRVYEEGWEGSKRRARASIAPVNRSFRALLQRHAITIFPQAGRERAEDEPADVGQVGYASGLSMGDRAGVEELREEPKADEERSRYECDFKKHEDEQNRANPVARIGDHEGAHHRGNRTAGAQVWDRGMRIG